MQPKTDKIICPSCLSKNIKKHGIQKNKLQNYQRYYCNNCKKTFSLQEKNKTYPINIILTALSLYNVGYSQSQIINKISRKFKIKPSQKTISNWLNNYRNVCTFHKLRKQAIELYSPEEMIETHVFMHNNLPYKFQIHKAKLALLFNSDIYNNKFTNIKKFEQPINSYFEKIPTGEFPHHIFKPKLLNQNSKEKLGRSSQLKFETLEFVKLQKQNLANELAGLALNLAKTNRDRHQSVQDFMLINDSTTIATEIPVYLTNDDIKYFLTKGFHIPLENQQTPITGHIDIVQIRNGLIHILDYKPEADKINPINQLTLYALALASRTRLALRDFKCAWFDENNYYEFFPLHVVYAKKEKR
jgi:transposase-like protein